MKQVNWWYGLSACAQIGAVEGDRAIRVRASPGTRRVAAVLRPKMACEGG